MPKLLTEASPIATDPSNVSEEDAASAAFAFRPHPETPIAEARAATPGSVVPAAQASAPSSQAGTDQAMSGGGETNYATSGEEEHYTPPAAAVPEPQLPVAVKSRGKVMPYGMDVVELRRVKGNPRPWQVCLRTVYNMEFDPRLRYVVSDLPWTAATLCFSRRPALLTHR